MSSKKNSSQSIGFMLVFMCLTLGLMPYKPEPHIVGKIRWVLGDPSSMGLADWFDLLMHGFPFVALIIWIVFYLFKRK